MHGVTRAYLAVVLALDVPAFIHLVSVMTVVLDALLGPVVGAGWVRVQCVHGQPVARGGEGANREEAQRPNKQTEKPDRRALTLSSEGLISDVRKMWDRSLCSVTKLA